MEFSELPFVPMSPLPFLLSRTDDLDDLRKHISRRLTRTTEFTTTVTDSRLELHSGRKRILVDRRDGSCSYNGTPINVYLSEECVAQLQEEDGPFRVAVRRKRVLPPTSAVLVQVSFLSGAHPDGIDVPGIRLGESDSYYFLEHDLKARRISYNLDRRQRVSNRQHTDIFHALKTHELVGRSAPHVYVVAKDDVLSRCLREEAPETPR